MLIGFRPFLLGCVLNGGCPSDTPGHPAWMTAINAAVARAWELPIWQVSPWKPFLQSHTSGAMHCPLFWHSGLQMAEKGDKSRLARDPTQKDTR